MLSVTNICHFDDTQVLMQVNFIAQPQEQLGVLLQSCLESPAQPIYVAIVSAFVSLQAVLRLKRRLLELHTGTTVVRVVVGVDMGGTSKEVLQELARWPIEVFVFKNRKNGVTFHPKLYIVETINNAEIFLGSNNLTDGGLYGNYEGSVRVTYSLPVDKQELDKAKLQLKKFIDPNEPVGRRLDETYLKILVARRDIPSDAESRQRRKIARGESGDADGDQEAFGFESTLGAPKLPLDVQQVVMAAVRHQLDELEAAKKKVRRERRGAEKQAKAEALAGAPVVLAEPLPEPDIRAFKPLAQITPTAFYLELVATKGTGKSIPGEQRIPLEALNVAQEFWGWPDNYTESINPKKGDEAEGEDRVYFNWKPVWHIHSVSDPAKSAIKNIRMYFYKNSSDYRFFSSHLKNWAAAGDIVRIIRCDSDSCVYDCALAIAGTPQHAEWKALCAASSTHSPRVFGFS